MKNKHMKHDDCNGQCGSEHMGEKQHNEKNANQSKKQHPFHEKITDSSKGKGFESSLEKQRSYHYESDTPKNKTQNNGKKHTGK